MNTSINDSEQIRRSAAKGRDRHSRQGWDRRGGTPPTGEITPVRSLQVFLESNILEIIPIVDSSAEVPSCLIP
eukprot:3437535-Pyramimonas_sp.AAC.1